MSEARKIVLEFPSFRAFLSEYGSRISADGMLLRSKSPPDPGSAVDVEVVLGDGMHLLRAQGETLWSGPTGSGGQEQEVAVRFDEMDEASRKLIGKIVDQRQREGVDTFQLQADRRRLGDRLRDLTVPAAPAFDEANPPPAGGGDAIFDLGEAPPPGEGASERPAADLPFFAPSVEAPAPPSEPPEPEPEPEQIGEPPEAVDLGLPADESELLADMAESERLKGQAEPLGAESALPEPPFRQPPPAELPPAEPPAAEPPAIPSEPPIEVFAPEVEEGLDRSRADLGDLFADEQPESVPERGLTEAFPPSFVDEVEAELESTEVLESSSEDVDAPWLEVPPAPAEETSSSLGPESDAMPVEPSAPETEPPPVAEPPRAPLEPEAPVELSPPEPEVEPEPVEPPGMESLELPPAESPSVPTAGGEAEPREEPQVDLGPPGIDQPVAPAAGGPPPVVEPSVAKEAGPEMVAQAEPEALEREPVEPPALPGAPRVGADTVEIPLPPTPGPRSDTAGELAPPAADELLSIPGLEAPAPPQPPPGLPESPLPSSAEALRGAAGRSRNLGTWLLIALLGAALAVAGYLGFGLLNDRAATEADADARTVPATPVEPAPPAAQEEAAAAADGAPVQAPAEAAAEGAPSEPAAADAAEPVTATSESAPAETEPAAAVEPEPEAQLSGLDRITWNETETETVLALVGDGAILRDQVELQRLGGANPRLVIKISGVSRAFQPATLELGTSHVRRVRTGLHAGGELHVVVDLQDEAVIAGALTAVGQRLELRLGREGG